MKEYEPKDFEMISLVSRNLLIQREHIENAPDFSESFLINGLTHPIHFNSYMIRDMAFLIKQLELPERTPDYQYIEKLLLKNDEISIAETVLK